MEDHTLIRNFASKYNTIMKIKRFLGVLSILMLVLTAQAQSTNPLAYYTDKDGYQQETQAIDDGDAPLDVTFKANPSADITTYGTPSYEWHFRVSRNTDGSKRTEELFVRYEEETRYTFTESGNYTIMLKTTIKTATDSYELDSTAITINIAESKLEFPNAFSPNGDGINDIYRAKPEYKNIIEFKAIILNRWGQKLYEWKDPAGGWDGKYHGHDVKDGVYFVLVKAKGADGKDYNYKRDVNLLRGFVEGTNTTK